MIWIRELEKREGKQEKEREREREVERQGVYIALIEVCRRGLVALAW
jgi:hypothetical protein